MDKKVQFLLESFLEFKRTIIEYTIVNNKIKQFVKRNGDNAVVEYYGLKIKKVDKSVFSNEIIQYLEENKLTNFIEKKIDSSKIEDLIKNGTLKEDYVIENIVKDKTFLDIKITNLKDYLISFSKDIEYKYAHTSTLNCIKRREFLKRELDRTRYLYSQTAKELKELLIENNLEQYRFKYNNELGILKIVIADTIYTDEFKEYLELNNINAFTTTVKHSELIHSKNKKIDRNIVDKYKTEIYQEFLYVKFLYGAFKKRKNKNNKKRT